MKPVPTVRRWAALLALTTAPSLAIEYANIEIIQNDAANNPTSVTATITAGTPGVSIAGQNRGDTDMNFGLASLDQEVGIAISCVTENTRDNSLGGDTIAGFNYANTSVAFPNSPNGGIFIPTHNMGGSAQNPNGRAEYNINFATVYFPYADYLSGHANVSSNGGPITVLRAAPGINLGTEFIDEPQNGIFTLDLTGLGSSSQDGVVLTCHGKNEGNFSMAKANADGTFSLSVMDNGEFGGGVSYEQDPVAFVYLPATAAGPNEITALGRVNSDGSTDVPVAPSRSPKWPAANGTWRSQVRTRPPVFSS